MGRPRKLTPEQLIANRDAFHKAYYEKNKEKLKEYRKARYQLNKEEIKQRRLNKNK